jgi:sigma-B regulation protein RsbU (phosphoserine phosphatase)
MTAQPANDGPGAPTILVVDDTPMNLSLFVRILEGSGYRILVARNGPAALDIARQTRPDLMLLDVVMPEMGGFEVCRELKKDPATSETVVIFLSALGEVSDKVSGLELGAADYITKPFQSEEVLARVRAHLWRKQLERELRTSRDNLASEMRSAGEMQQLLLPPTLPGDGRVTFAAFYRTSLQAGGDYYDVLTLPGGTFGVFLADVSGHGARAAVVMAMMRTLLHSSCEPLEDPAGVLDGMNRHFSYLLETPLFATALYAVIDPVAMRLRIACAGHPKPVLLRAGQAVTPLPSEGALPLFMFEPTVVPMSNHELHAGDRLLFYTDGVTERETISDEMFGLERLMDSLARNAGRNPADLIQGVVDEVDSFAEGSEPQDDQTILLAALA